VKKLEKLQRYASPEAAIDAMFAAQSRISSGELKPVLKKDASATELKDWREAHGIPEVPEKYDIGEVKIDESDKPMMAEIFKAAHLTNQTPEQVRAVVATWNKIKEVAFENRAAADQKAQKDGEDALRAEWGPEYRRNINLVHGMLDGAATPGMKDKVLSGRLSDGTPIGSSPDALKFLAGLALIQNPTGIVVPGAEANPMQGVQEELVKIETIMRTDRKTYNKDEAMQARYRDLLEAREKLKART
jgi:hypothetical protein